MRHCLGSFYSRYSTVVLVYSKKVRLGDRKVVVFMPTRIRTCDSIRCRIRRRARATYRSQRFDSFQPHLLTLSTTWDNEANAREDVSRYEEGKGLQRSVGRPSEGEVKEEKDGARGENRIRRFRLALYVYEYLCHIGATKTAQTFLGEVTF